VTAVEIEVVVADARTGTVIDRAYAHTPDDARYAARVIYDESLRGLVGERRVLRFYVDGKHVATVDRRP
jgi:hypothetical protein